MNQNPKSNFHALEKNLIDVIQEQQLKLGYRKEILRFYYPLSSLNHCLGTACDIAEMKQQLKAFREFSRERLGELKFSNQGERFCILLPPEGAAYVKEQVPENPFLTTFLQTIGRHGCTMDELRSVFGQFSDHVHLERVSGEDYDYLLYFEDGIPDDYRYCIEDEGEHLIYHRFSPADYEEL